MGKIDLASWSSDSSLLALALHSGEMSRLFGLASARVTVPAGTAAYVVRPNGETEVVTEKSELSGSYAAVFVRLGEFEVPFVVEDLTSEDHVHLDRIQGELRLSIDREEPRAVEEFARGPAAGAPVVSIDSIGEWLSYEVKRAVAETACRHPAEALREVHRLHEPIETALRERLDRFLLGKGCRFHSLARYEVHSEQLLELLQRQRQEQLEVLHQEAALKERLRARENLKQLARILKSSHLEQLLGQLPDSESKELVYRWLMRRDLSLLTRHQAEEALGEMDGPMQELLMAALGNLQASGAAPPWADVKIPPRRLVSAFIAAGPRLLRCRPGEESSCETLVELAEPLRSVRWIPPAPGRPGFLLAGAKTRLYLHPLDGATREYLLPSGARPRGGINAATLSRDELLATHSEFGLVRWDLNAPGTVGEILFEELTSRKETTRSVLCAEDGRVYFAAGPIIYALGLEEPARQLPTPLQPYAELPVTSIAVHDELLVASCGRRGGGALMAWNRHEPEAGSVWSRLHMPIVAARLAHLKGMTHVVYACRDHALSARVLGQSLETRYEAGSFRIAMADGAADRLVGLDHLGTTVCFWDPRHPDRAAGTIRLPVVGDHVALDLVVETELLEPTSGWTDREARMTEADAPEVVVEPSEECETEVASPQVAAEPCEECETEVAPPQVTVEPSEECETEADPALVETTVSPPAAVTEAEKEEAREPEREQEFQSEEDQTIT